MFEHVGLAQLRRAQQRQVEGAGFELLQPLLLPGEHLDPLELLLDSQLGSDVLYERDEQVSIVTLNRPEKLNALNASTISELGRAIAEVRSREDIRGLIVTGAGRAFCAGLDLKQSGARRNSEGANMRGPDAGLLGQRRISEIVMRMRRCGQPIIPGQASTPTTSPPGDTSCAAVS